jgi:hypothetical protein
MVGQGEALKATGRCARTPGTASAGNSFFFLFLMSIRCRFLVASGADASSFPDCRVGD